MHPRASGQCLIPRYGGGWMHQFGHVYALQQELLNPNSNNWFRAVELWHTAREEGVAMNSQHFNNILRQCTVPGAWEQSLKILKQMKRENIRPDVVGVGAALVSMVEGGQYDHVETVFNEFKDKMLLDSVCYLALMKSKLNMGDAKAALEAGRRQEAEKVPYLPYTYTVLLESAILSEEPEYAMHLVQQMKQDRWTMDPTVQKKLLAFGERCGKNFRQLETEDAGDRKRIS